MSDAGKKPLERIRVEVETEPVSRNSFSDRQLAQKVAKRLKEVIERLLNDPNNKNAGSDQQYREADRALDLERDQVPRKGVRRIKVRITGDRQDRHGKNERLVREREVEPAG
jgi:hypothetical protein